MRNNKIIMLLCSFFVAVGLWLYVVTDVSTGDDATLNDVPITYLNQEDLKVRGLMMISGETQVSLRLYGNRTDLLTLTKDSVNITVDLGVITEPGVYELKYERITTLPDDVEVLNYNPAKVTVEIVEYAENTVPVLLNYTGEMAEGLLLDKESAELDYDTVLVSGPKETVDQIASAVITVDRTGLTETLDDSYRYTLVDENEEPVDAALITTNTEEIHLRLPVEHIKEIPLKVELIPGGGATDETTVVEILPSSSISISGSEEALAQIDELVLGSIDLATVTGAKQFEFQIQLPETVTNQSGVSTAQVNVSFEGLITKTFTLDVDNILAANVPEGLEATPLTRQVEITLRGPKASMSGVTLANIVASVDYTGQDAGTVTVPLTITVQGYSDVGAVGKYSVSVTLAPPSPETETEPGE